MLSILCTFPFLFYEITGDKARNVTEMSDLVHLKKSRILRINYSLSVGGSHLFCSWLLNPEITKQKLCLLNHSLAH